MKKIVFLISMLILSLSSFGFAADQASRPIDKIIVDKTPRNTPLNNYAVLTRDHIQNVWTTPVNLMTSDALKGKVAVKYEIARDGSLVSVQLVRGSGNPDMDRSLIKAIRSAAPFPAFPRDLTAGNVLIKANFIVADLPVVPVLKVEHRMDSQGPSETTQVDSHKKYIWGVPAGTALRKDISIPAEEALKEKTPTAVEYPHSTKFKWGINTDK